MSLHYCSGCFEKQQKINSLEDKLMQVNAKLKYQEERAKDGYFGSSTPSSQVPVKASSLPERQAKTGGAKNGHPGHGRRKPSTKEADRVDVVPCPDKCPDCGCTMEHKDIRERVALDMNPVKVESIIYQMERKRCPKCEQVTQGKPPGLLPKCQLGNGLLSYVAVQHYLYGTTMGQIERQLGIGYGSLIKAMHMLSRIWEPVLPLMMKQYQGAQVRHADETSWRTDGQNGYAWLFCTKDLKLFRFRNTRSASVVQEVFGSRHLPGVLVVDRYAGYNKVPCSIQYCYAHLLRDVKDLQKEFPDQKEVLCFVETVAPLLSAAMSLRGQGLSFREYRRRAKEIQAKLICAMNRPAQHPAIRGIQALFKEKKDRMYHWVKGPHIPAENNLAERELRSLVIARKISFGSQSISGAHTREVLMCVLHTISKRSARPIVDFRSMLDQIAQHPSSKPSGIFSSRLRSPPNK